MDDGEDPLKDVLKLFKKSEETFWEVNEVVLSGA